MSAQIDARDYLAADAIVRNLLRIIGPGTRVVVDADNWTIYRKGADKVERPVCAARSLCDLVSAVAEMVVPK